MLVDMKDCWKFFKGKKITQMGLGLLGRGVGDAAFLAKCLSADEADGANVLVTDLKSKKELAPSLKKLKKYKNIKYVLDRHRLADFRNCDFVLKAAGVPLDSPYIAEAKKHGIPIEMDASLFFKLMPKGVTFIGVTGTRGKTTTVHLIYEILKRLNLKDKKGSTFLAGNIKDTATLPLLEKVGLGDFVVAELDSWQLQGFGDSKVSPHISVFTTFLPDHMNYYAGSMKKYFQDKASIFKYQKKGNVLILGEQVENIIRRNLAGQGFAFKNLKSTTIITNAEDLPTGWKLKIPGEHNRYNVACALAVARALEIPDEISKKAIENFKGVPGRLELIRVVRGVKIYNDTCATTQDATIAALHALNNSSFEKRKIILILGGTDKGLDMSKLVAEIPKHCKAVILLKETGTDKLLSEFPYLKSPVIKGVPESARVGAIIKETLKECVKEAMKIAQKGDIVLFSPAFASFGKWFKNEYDRGEQFEKLVKGL
ncbi:MAG: UDP-N-acetylmuramoylalanine-D-glutamate ligase [Parcubacteria group bacterium GW2011_GWB1_44_7]|nr:MAG: UDP-N-acetylmuramoylalanine-D-glutamate ligase [Parcubacteria group bacterium GW2011_GWB1_44_7]